MLRALLYEAANSLLTVVRKAHPLKDWARRGKKIPVHREGMVHLIGFALLMGGIVLVSINDIGRLIDGRSFLG